MLFPDFSSFFPVVQPIPPPMVYFFPLVFPTWRLPFHFPVLFPPGTPPTHLSCLEHFPCRLWTKPKPVSLFSRRAVRPCVDIQPFPENPLAVVCSGYFASQFSHNRPLPFLLAYPLSVSRLFPFDQPPAPPPNFCLPNFSPFFHTALHSFFFGLLRRHCSTVVCSCLFPYEHPPHFFFPRWILVLQSVPF